MLVKFLADPERPIVEVTRITSSATSLLPPLLSIACDWLYFSAAVLDMSTTSEKLGLVGAILFELSTFTLNLHGEKSILCSSVVIVFMNCLQSTLHTEIIN